MKRTITFILSTFLLLGALVLPVPTEAAALTSKAGAVTTKSGALNVRASASTNAAILGTVRKGSYITLLSRSGEWWHVEYGDGQYGYCHADYITIVQGIPANSKA